MVVPENPAPYRDRSRLLVIFGYLCLLLGLGFALLAPLEIYCFRFFSPGGRFHYDGFGFGSFMFNNITAQIFGYYLLAAILIPLGYGHIKRRRWIRAISLTALWTWLAIGAPVIIATFLILAGTKDLAPLAALAALILLGLLYFVLPGLLIRFYRGRDVGLTLEAAGGRPGRLERVPIPVLVLSTLYLFHLTALHFFIMFNGIFPLFGSFRYGLPGVVLLDSCLACLGALTWGTWRRQPWAWWGSVIFFGLFTVSSMLTLLRTSYSSLLSGLDFPARELEFLAGLPLQGWHLAILAGIPLLATLATAIKARRWWARGDRAKVFWGEGRT